MGLMGKHPFRVREIAAQAGLSEATVDRALNGRTGVRAGTVEEVQRAVADLERQRAQLRVSGRTFMVDVVVQAPGRFSRAVKHALEAELPYLRPANIRSRFHLFEGSSEASVVAALRKVRRTGSHGVILKAPDSPDVRREAARLVEARIPLVTFVTDLTDVPRQAYVGLDNRAAGATAAYLLTGFLQGPPGRLLMVRGRGSYAGEDERIRGFLEVVQGWAPGTAPLEVVDDEELRSTVRDSVLALLADVPDVAGVYSLYAGAGGNGAVLQAFEEAGVPRPRIVAHDLDGENLELLRDGKLAAVLHHDLAADMRKACRVILNAQRAVDVVLRQRPSTVHVVTPHNLPAGAEGDR